MRRFFVENIAEKAFLEGDEAQHMHRVLRMKSGDSVILFDGSGYDYLCEIEEISDKKAVLFVKEKKENTRKLNFSLTLYQSFIKKDKLDYVVQKATELGVCRIVCFNSARTVKNPDKKDKMKERYERIAKEAAKQCGRATIPKVEFLESTSDILSEIENYDECLLAYENENVTLKSIIGDGNFGSAAVIVGPEGGFESEEAKMLVNGGAKSCSLGNLILRAETAGIAACSMIIYEKMEK